MIPVFRKIRKQLADNNRPLKYLRYAFGEIVLVVIGILIALQINNWNEKRKNDQKFLKILTEIKADLLNDIQETSYFIKWWGKTSLKVDKVLDSNNVNPISKLKIDKEIFKLGTVRYPIVISDLSFNKLNDMKGELPEKYIEIVNKLNRLYVEQGKFVYNTQKDFFNHANAYRDKIYKTYDWVYNLEKGKYSDEIVNYFYHNNEHKRNLLLYKILGNRYNSAIITFHEHSFLNYLILHNLTSPNKKLPSLFNRYNIVFKKNDPTEYTGIYQRDNDTIAEKIKFELKYNLLMVSNLKERKIYGEGYVLQELGKDSISFVYTDKDQIKIKRDSTGNVIGFIDYYEKGSDTVSVYFKKITND